MRVDRERPAGSCSCEDGDASPLLAASDLMVTDHSSVGFEFCLLDRPLIVFDAPALASVARINQERIAALRSAARVVRDASELGRAANQEVIQPDRLRRERRAAAEPLFHGPGSATDRALELIYSLVGLARPAAAGNSQSMPLPRPDHPLAARSR